MDCKKRTVLCSTNELYPDEPELHGRPAWRCECGAHAQCKKGTLLPAAKPAGPATREARHRAYVAFHKLAEALPETRIGRRKVDGHSQALFLASKAAKIWVGDFKIGNLDRDRALAVEQSLLTAIPR